MTSFPFRFSIPALVVGVSFVSSSAAQAQGRDRPMGPSAAMAARLKQYPTPSWLAHYLPEDRGRIAGGIWRYVSTETEPNNRFYRPDSPFMLRQSPENVIGFSSLRDAEEAGYAPDRSILETASLTEFDPNIKSRIAQEEVTAPPLVVLNNGLSMDESVLSQLNPLYPRLVKEARYIEAVHVCLLRMDAVTDRITLGRKAGDLAVFIAYIRQARPLFNQSVDDYNRLAAPPRFRKGDQMLRVSFKRFEHFFEDVERGVDRTPVLKQALTTEGGLALISFGHAEIEIGHRMKDFSRDMNAVAASLSRKSSR